LDTILELGKKGFPICLKKQPKEAGKIKSGTFESRLKILMSFKNVSTNFNDIIKKPPLIKGDNLPDFWCRIDDSDYYIFFAHPKAQNLTFPLTYGQSYINKTIEKTVRINIMGISNAITLRFEPYQSILLKIDKKVTFTPLI